MRPKPAAKAKSPERSGPSGSDKQRLKRLRVLTRDEVNAYSIGGFVDERFPSAELRAALKPLAGSVDLKDFGAAFGRKLGIYRARRSSVTDSPPVAVEQQLLEEAGEYIDQVRLRLSHLPPQSSAWILLECQKTRGEGFREFARRLDEMLQGMHALIVRAERRLEPLAGRAGRKDMALRDLFLHDVAKLIEPHGLKKEAAACIAAQLLRAVEVDAPEDPKEARKLVRRIEESQRDVPSGGNNSS